MPSTAPQLLLDQVNTSLSVLGQARQVNDSPSNSFDPLVRLEKYVALAQLATFLKQVPTFHSNAALTTHFKELIVPRSNRIVGTDEEWSLARACPVNHAYLMTLDWITQQCFSAPQAWYHFLFSNNVTAHERETQINTFVLECLFPTVIKEPSSHVYTVSTLDEVCLKQLHLVTLSYDGAQLIFVPDALQSLLATGQYTSPVSIQSSSSSGVYNNAPLKPDEINKVTQSCPQATTLASQIEGHFSAHKLNCPPDNMLMLFNQLIVGLRLGGANHRSRTKTGTEEVAGDQANIAIAHFFVHYNQLSKYMKRKIKRLKKTIFIEENPLYRSVGEALTELRPAHVIDDSRIQHCVEMVANFIEDVINTDRNEALLKSITLPSKNKQGAPHTEQPIADEAAEVEVLGLSQFTQQVTDQIASLARSEISCQQGAALVSRKIYGANEQVELFYNLLEYMPPQQLLNSLPNQMLSTIEIKALRLFREIFNNLLKSQPANNQAVQSLFLETRNQADRLVKLSLSTNFEALASHLIVLDTQTEKEAFLSYLLSINTVDESRRLIHHRNQYQQLTQLVDNSKILLNKALGRDYVYGHLLPGKKQFYNSAKRNRPLRGGPKTSLKTGACVSKHSGQRKTFKH